MKQVIFINQAWIKIRARCGGDEINSFHQKNILNMVDLLGIWKKWRISFFVADKNQNTLLNFRGHSLFKDESEIIGAKNNMISAREEDLIISVLLETELVFDEDKKVGLVLKTKFI